MPAHLIHGMEGTLPYRVYTTMKQRCTNPNDKQWHRYGGRGINVCPRWSAGFLYFWQDMGATYEEGLSIERRDNNGDYSPENCYWATMHVQQRNRRNNIWLTMPDGRKLVAADAAAEVGLRKDIVYQRISRGWPDSMLLAPSGSRVFPPGPSRYH